MDISIIIPVYNEERNIAPLCHLITEQMDGIGREYEVLFIDDGSKDSTFEELGKIAKDNRRVKVISFRRNFGQTAAMMAGFDHARGEIIVALDGDLQNDPKDIPKILDKLEEGYDIVSGWRKSRQDNFILRIIPSKIANWLIGLITGVRLHDYGCSLKAYRAEVIKNIRLYGDMHRFIPALASMAGGKIAEIEVNHLPRKYGNSNYGLSRTLKVILDLIAVKFLLAFSTKPIQLFGLLGLSSVFGGFLFLSLAIFMKIYLNTDMTGNPLLLLSVLLVLLGVQFIGTGLLAEVTVRTYHESQNKPTYLIKQIIDNGKMVE
ncbi:MAG: glycosyl transferase [Nitrospinae bacterium RIFCSPLOWO2_12_FULL_45_22]|nr:MAG: glycosyl transferase [Nitrospinae bacterium RIFCSPLOWO2_12_FULL_45_22]